MKDLDQNEGLGIYYTALSKQLLEISQIHNELAERFNAGNTEPLEQFSSNLMNGNQNELSKALKVLSDH